MANYIYSTHLFKAGASVINGPVDNDANLTDFETNHKASATDISDIVIQELTFETNKTYDEFEALITGDIDWTDVKYIEQPDHYELYIVTISPL